MRLVQAQDHFVPVSGRLLVEADLLEAVALIAGDAVPGDVSARDPRGRSDGATAAGLDGQAVFDYYLAQVAAVEAE